MKPVRLLCYMSSWTWRCTTFNSIPSILIVLTNGNVPLIYSIPYHGEQNYLNSPYMEVPLPHWGSPPIALVVVLHGSWRNWKFCSIKFFFKWYFSNLKFYVRYYGIIKPCFIRWKKILKCIGLPFICTLLSKIHLIKIKVAVSHKTRKIIYVFSCNYW